MEKLIKKYNNECDITSKLADKTWRIGNIIVLICVLYYTILGKTLTAVLTEVIGFISLYILCEYINIKKIKNKLGLKKLF